MTAKVYVVTDLGVGDGGKGGVVHKIASMMRAHTVIKVGGAQGSHGVRTSRGEAFNFSQWGCGTPEGIPTHLSQRMIVSPIGLLNEAEALRYQLGIYDAFSLLTADERALCATPFHGIASRIYEMARRDQPRGTIGTGVGEAYRDFKRQPHGAIMVGNLRSPDLKARLAATRERMQRDLQYDIELDFLPEDRGTLQEEVRMLYDDRFLDFVVEQFETVGKLLRVVGQEYLGGVILAREGSAVVESSHGVLSDRLVGFYPHTSAIRTLPCFTHAMLAGAGFQGEIVDIGVSRAYAIRHGAGPMPTADPEMAERLLPGSNKDENRYQGKVRVGPLDFVLMRYALKACGGPNAFDGMAVTWFDQIQANRSWQVCFQYANASHPDFFSPSGELLFGDSPNLEHQSGLGRQLLECNPRIVSMPIDAMSSNDDLYGVCAEVVQEAVAVPVRMVSFGPTELDKLCK